MERMILLRVVDNLWMDHIDAMDQLKSGIGLRALGQQDPAAAYAKEGFDMFEQMISAIQEDAMQGQGQLPEGAQVPERENKPETYRREQPKVGRNDPCPCGSGKKYKNCCGKNM